MKDIEPNYVPSCNFSVNGLTYIDVGVCQSTHRIEIGLVIRKEDKKKKLSSKQINNFQ